VSVGITTDLTAIERKSRAKRGDRAKRQELTVMEAVSGTFGFEVKFSLFFYLNVPHTLNFTVASVSDRLVTLMFSIMF